MMSTRPRRPIALLAGALLVALAGGTTGCAPRQVEVRTAVDRGADVTLTVANATSRPVNVYVDVGGTALFLRQVAANSTELLPMRGVTEGSTVTLRAISIDGRSRYEKRDVLAQGAVRWGLP